MVHVLHIIDGLPRGGAERMLVDVANSTAAAGLRVSACVTRCCTDMASCLAPEIDLHVLGRRGRFDIVRSLRLLRIIRDHRVSLLHAHSRSTFSLLALLKTAGLLRIPVVLHDHFGWIEKDASIPRWFAWAAPRHVAAYVGVHGMLADWAVAAGIPRSRIRTVGNALDLTRIAASPRIEFDRAFSLPPTATIGVVVAGVRRAKGIDTLAECLALRPIPSGLRILIVGGTPDEKYLRECRSHIKQAGLENHLLLVGSRDDVGSILRSAHFALLPSRSESGPLAVIEYLAAGLPFVSTLVGDVARRAHAEGVIEFVPPENPRAMRDGLDRVLNLSPDERRQRVERGLRIAGDLFDIRKAVPTWIEIYTSAVKSVTRCAS